MLETLMQGLAANGPWAVMAGFLLVRILRAWDSDRKQAMELMGEFRATMQRQSDALSELTAAVRALRKSVDEGAPIGMRHE
jgi:hypothetical protein